MKKLICLTVVLVLLTTFIGCDKETEIKEVNQIENSLTDNNITGIEQINNDLISLFNNSFNSTVGAKNVDVENAEVLNYSNSDLSAIVADYSNDKNKSFIAYYDNIKKEVNQAFIIEEIDGKDNITVVFNDVNEIPYLQIKFYKESGKIYEVANLSTNKIIAPTFSECMELAFTSCMDDWQCAILCGLTFKYCVASIAIACMATT